MNKQRKRIEKRIKRTLLQKILGKLNRACGKPVLVEAIIPEEVEHDDKKRQRIINSLSNWQLHQANKRSKGSLRSLSMQELNYFKKLTKENMRHEN